MRFPERTWLIAFTFAALVAALGGALAQDIVLSVNGDPISSDDIRQRTIYENLIGADFKERITKLLTGDQVREEFRRRMFAAQPRTRAEAEQAAGRIKKELMEDAKRQVLTGGGISRDDAIEALIREQLKLQAARKLRIEIADEAVEARIVARLSTQVSALGEDGKPDLNDYYASLEGFGLSRKTLREICRAELAWRAVILRVYKTSVPWEVYGAYARFSRSFLETLRQNAVIEHAPQE